MAEYSFTCDMPRSICHPDGCEQCQYKEHRTFFDEKGKVVILDDNGNEIKFKHCEVENCPIEIHNDLDPACELYNPEDKYVGTIRNETALHDVRVQIKRNKLSGYYVLFKGEKIHIDVDGNIEEYPEGFYDASLNLAGELL